MFHQPTKLKKNEKTFRYERTPAKTELKIYIPQAAQLSKLALEKLRQVDENYMVKETKESLMGSVFITALFVAVGSLIAFLTLAYNLFIIFEILLWMATAVCSVIAIGGIWFTVEDYKNFRTTARVGHADTRGIKGYLSDDVRFKDLCITTGMTSGHTQRIKDEIATGSMLGQILDELIASHMLNTQVLVNALANPDLPPKEYDELTTRRKQAADKVLEKIRKAIVDADTEVGAAKTAKIDAARGEAQAALALTEHLVQKELF